MNVAMRGAWMAAFAVMCGCGAPTMLEVRGNTTALRQARRVVLIQTVVSPPDIPDLPLIDAAVYKGEMNDSAAQILALHKQFVAPIDARMGQRLASSFHTEVVYGPSLRAWPVYRSLPQAGVRVYSTAADDEDYGGMVVPDGTFNLFDFRKSESVVDFFTKDSRNGRKPRPLGPEATNLARAAAVLQADLLVVATATVVVHGVNAYGAGGERYLHIEAVVFDRAGRPIAHGFSRGPLRYADADAVDDYRAHLAGYGPVIDDLVASLVDPSYVQRASKRTSAPAAKPVTPQPRSAPASAAAPTQVGVAPAATAPQPPAAQAAPQTSPPNASPPGNDDAGVAPDPAPPPTPDAPAVPADGSAAPVDVPEPP